MLVGVGLPTFQIMDDTSLTELHRGSTAKGSYEINPEFLESKSIELFSKTRIRS